jgi:hypothetical protein
MVPHNFKLLKLACHLGNPSADSSCTRKCLCLSQSGSVSSYSYAVLIVDNASFSMHVQVLVTALWTTVSAA